MARTQFDAVIGFFDSIAHAEEVTGIPDRSWRNWKDSGFITQKKHLHILLAARGKSILMPPTVFVEHLIESMLESSDSRQTESAGAVPAEAG